MLVLEAGPQNVLLVFWTGLVHFSFLKRYHYLLCRPTAFFGVLSWYMMQKHYPSMIFWNIPTSESIHVSNVYWLIPCLSCQIASFFLGWVFICSLLCIVTSPVICRLDQMCYNAFDDQGCLATDANFHNRHSTLWNNSKKPPIDTLFWGDRDSSTKSLEEENAALVLLLSFCFTFASVAHFSSLLSFNSNSGASACCESYGCHHSNTYLILQRFLSCWKEFLPLVLVSWVWSS